MTTPDTYTPLLPAGARINRGAEYALMHRLDSGDGPVLVRVYAGTNTATTAAYKLTREKVWRISPPAGYVLEFYTRRLREGGPYGVFAHYVRKDQARG